MTDGPRTVALNAQGNILVGAGSGEGTDVLIKLSPDGKHRLWGVRQLEVAGGVERLAVWGDTVFVLQKNKNVFALDATHGSKRGGKVFYNALHTPDLSGAPVVTRVDDQIWFRGSYFAHCSEIKAPPFFAQESPVPATEFSARWTGEVEPR